MCVDVYARMPVKVLSTTDVPFTAKNFYTSSPTKDDKFGAKYVSEDQLNFTPASVFTWI